MSATDQELTSLAASHDIISIGMLADDIRRRRHGTKTTFVRVASVSAEPGAPIAVPAAAGEVRISGAPSARSSAAERVREVLAGASGVAVSAFSLADLEALAASEQTTLRALLEELRGAGLELIAEAPIDKLRDPRRAIEDVNIAGLALARVTVERSPEADPLPLLKTVSNLQRDVAVLRAFAPLPRRVNPAAPSTGYDDVKRVALARIVCDNIPTIQVDWSLYGPKLAQVALTVGADDVDGIAAEDDQSQGHRRSPLEEIRRNIRAAGFEAVERSGRFDVISA